MRHRHADLIKKWAENTNITIEFKNPFDDTWHITQNPSWNPGNEYREVNPYQEFIDAFNSGKTIQASKSFDFTDEWKDLSFPLFTLPVERYRIKPEPKCVPFTFEDAKFLIGKTITEHPKYSGKVVRMITGVYERGVDINLSKSTILSFESLLENYVFIDGSPCGKLVI